MLGEKIKNLIMQSGIPKEEIAAELGVSLSSLYNMFKKESVESRYLNTLMSLFDVDANYFFEGHVQYTEHGTNIQNITSGKNNTVTVGENSPLERENEILKMENERLKVELSLKNEIIELLRSQKG